MLSERTERRAHQDCALAQWRLGYMSLEEEVKRRSGKRRGGASCTGVMCL